MSEKIYNLLFKLLEEQHNVKIDYRIEVKYEQKRA